MSRFAKTRVNGRLALLVAQMLGRDLGREEDLRARNARLLDGLTAGLFIAVHNGRVDLFRQ